MPNQVSQTLHQNALNGGRVSRYGDAVMVVMESIAFFTTAQDFQMGSQWARSKQSLGSANKDRMAFANRFETVVARVGSGIATKGSNKVLSKLVAAMEIAGMDLKEWSIPHNLNESMEVEKKDKDEEPVEEEAKPDEEKPEA